MLKPSNYKAVFHVWDQPPSGGCVLKPEDKKPKDKKKDPAAFRRLCVETGGGTLEIVDIGASRLQAAVC